MESCACIYNAEGSFAASAEILSRSCAWYLASAASAAGFTRIFTVGALCEDWEGAESLPIREGASYFSALAEESSVLVFFEALPALTAATVKLLAASECALLSDDAHEPLALHAPGSVVAKLSGKRETLVEELTALGPIFTEVSLTEADGGPVTQGAQLYDCQEILRRRINARLMQRGAILVDPSTAYISPEARVESGAVILPGCMLNGKTHIEAMAKIGPNSVITDSVIGCGASINNSQVVESTVGAQTTVGPYAYLRPGCDVGEKARIGTFIEMKKAKVGNGTKMAHLSYLGDIELGQRCNIGGGVIVVNYDGKKKHKTTVGDDCFIGCNVNLVSPVEIHNGAYVAAGSTITDEVPENALSIARARQVNKADWAKKRREKGVL